MKRILPLLIALPLFAAGVAAQELSTSDARDYSRETLRSIFLQAAEEGAEQAPRAPIRDGWRLFSFGQGGSRTTVRFNPFGINWAAMGGAGGQINPIVDPFVMTGNAGSALSPRNRNRYTEWWVNRRLGFDIDPDED